MMSLSGPFLGASPMTNVTERLHAGLSGRVEIVVAEKHTAPHVGSGHVHVLATPVMVNLMEAAALQAVDGLLPEGFQTVGTKLDIRHFAATPVGLRASARAEVVAIEGRTLTFRLSAEDEREPIGDGTHERIVINVARFDQRIQDKLPRP
jgi:predicted thioesterase